MTTVEKFCKEKGISVLDSKELILDTKSNITGIRKINLCDMLEEYAKQKAIDFRVWDYYKPSMDLKALREECRLHFDFYINDQI